MIPYLEPPVPRAYPTAFCLAGSGGRDLQELGDRIRARPKGPDLLSRIPSGNEFSVVPLGPGDQVLVSIVQLMLAAGEGGRSLHDIEKLALYYLAANPKFTSARQLRSAAAQAAQRIPVAEDRLRYDYLFSAGDPENKRFWTDLGSDWVGLESSFVHVFPGSVLGSLRTEGLETAPRGSAEVSGVPRIAVLPLANISPEAKDEYFASGLTEELISTISQIKGLRVIARTSVMQYKSSVKSVAQIGNPSRFGLTGSSREPVPSGTKY